MDGYNRGWVICVESKISSNDVTCESKVGEKFVSFEAFTSKLEHHKNKVLAEFWRQDSRTIGRGKRCTL